MYHVAGRSGATAATADHALSALWNPHATQRIVVYELHVFATTAPAAGAGLYLRRITARGTAGSTRTPGIESHSHRGIAPPSGVLLDMAVYSVQPTLDPVGAGPLGSLYRLPFAVVAGSGFIIPFPRGLEIPPAAGLALLNLAGVIFPASDLGFSWEE